MKTLRDPSQGGMVCRPFPLGYKMGCAQCGYALF